MVVARQDPDAVRLFCVKRHSKSGFLGGALVFPGGKVSASDRDPLWEEQSTQLTPRALGFADDAATARAFAIAALRELLEEAAILPTAGDRLAGDEVEQFRKELSEHAGEPGDDSSRFRELLRARDLLLDSVRLEALSRWVTPRAEERRYDTRFYVLVAPPGQAGRHDDHETTQGFWASPSEIVALWERGEAFLAPPTLRTVQLFERASSLQQVLDVARAHHLAPVCPEFVLDGDVGALALPGDVLYPEPHPPPADPDAPTRFVLEDGRFLPRRVVRG